MRHARGAQAWHATIVEGEPTFQRLFLYHGGDQLLMEPFQLLLVHIGARPLPPWHRLLLRLFLGLLLSVLLGARLPEHRGVHGIFGELGRGFGSCGAPPTVPTFGYSSANHGVAITSAPSIAYRRVLAVRLIARTRTSIMGWSRLQTRLGGARGAACMLAGLVLRLTHER